MEIPSSHMNKKERLSSGHHNNGDNRNSVGGNNSSVSLLNLVLCVMCISSLGLSLYVNFRQTHFEDRLRHLRHIEERINFIEAKLQNLPSSSSSSYSQFPQSLSTAADFSNVANVVRKLSLQVEGIQRLRRDVSHLQMTRRQRQASTVQSSQECICPPGVFNVQFFSYFDMYNCLFFFSYSNFTQEITCLCFTLVSVFCLNKKKIKGKFISSILYVNNVFEKTKMSSCDILQTIKF